MEALRHIRTMRGMNQVDLAKASGVAQNTISEIELGKREARPGTLKKLADALGVGIADLLGDTSPKAPGRSSPESSLSDELKDERLRAAFVAECRYHAEERAERYDRRLAEAQAGGVFAGHAGARVLFEHAYLEYQDLQALFLHLSFPFAEGLPEDEFSRFSGLLGAALVPLGKTVDRIADRAAELAKTGAEKAEVERRREQMRRSA